MNARPRPPELSRRHLLAAGGALIVSFSLSGHSEADETGATPSPAKEAALPGSLAKTPVLDAWIRVDEDGRITAFTGKAELGQGMRTAVIQLAAEQLAVAPESIELITADTGRTPDESFTAGSHSMQDSGTAIFNAAGQVRSLLMQAAATRFALPVDQLTARDGFVHAPDGRSLGYGALSGGLSLHVSAEAATGLGDPKAYRIIGKSLPRVDIPAKLTGGAAYIQDMRLPGMLHARVVRQPSPGAKLRSVDFGAIEKLPGVVKVVHDGDYLAVIAEREWQAVKAWRALAATAEWSENTELPEQASLHATIQALPARDIEVLTWTAPAGAAVKHLQARFTKPYLMHGSIGPSCALAQFSGDGVIVWTHTQGVYPQRGALAELLRLPPEKVRCIHVRQGLRAHESGIRAPKPTAVRHKGSGAVLYIEPQKLARRWRDLVSLKLNS
jgi:nicotinate dehydrogenase subunit B